MAPLEFPLRVYVDDDFRIKFFSDPDSMLNVKAREKLLKSKKPAQYSFDERDMLVRMHPDTIGPEDMFKLQRMLKKVEEEKMSAQDIIDWAVGKK